ncbi:hypothetical protein K458DRAFT_13206 [Lentithecium fluviatile CBS 122367]|uniref:Rhodopsin domain-containing protein n=1 Tax=Lentithecium fluviatile CBS 122367 TaxID=1168545 RepID=A0A6G1J521_9PLEO|nr:hypothetical protein K458DRAFT_13206 [Lentithecium fluviatile CBS 122367]
MSFTISPSDVTPDYLAEDLGPTIIATASLMIIFCTAFVGLRYWARYLTQTPFGAEDVFIPFAWLSEMGLCTVAIAMVKYTGTGRHTIKVLDEDPAKFTNYLKGVTANEFLHPAAVAFPKICVVLLFLRVFTNKYERMAAWGLIGVIFAAWLSFTVATMFQCVPFAFNWDKNIQGATCFNFRAFATSSSVPNIVTDVVVLFLPIRTVVDLKISIGRRVGLMLIFLTGSILHRPHCSLRLH